VAETDHPAEAEPEEVCSSNARVGEDCLEVGGQCIHVVGTGWGVRADPPEVDSERPEGRERAVLPAPLPRAEPGLADERDRLTVLGAGRRVP
jgi:hypothetical protein